MNLVKQITDQLSGETLGQLGSLLGTDTETTERAATAAVPSLLASLAGMMSSDDGAKKLTNTLSGLDSSGLGNITQMLGGNAESLLNRGTGMLGSLFGDSMVAGIASAVSRFTGVNAGVIKSLMGYLMPLVLGKVAAQWKSQGGTTTALRSLFSDQRENFSRAMPAGFSLADLPDATEVRQPTYSPSPSRKAEPEPVGAGASARWLLPLAALLLGGFFLWQFMARPKAAPAVAAKPVENQERVTVMKPVVPETIAVPDLASMRTNLSGLFKQMDTVLAGIHDAASAEAAKPALRELNTKIDAMQQMLSRLPAASTTALHPMIEEQVDTVTRQAETASSIKGVDADFRTLIREIVSKLAKWISASTS